MIDLLMKYDLNAYSFLLLAIVIMIILIKKNFHSFENRLFRGITYLTMLVVLFEVLSWIWDRQSGDLAFELNYLFNMLFSILPTAVTCLWASYIDFKIFGDEKRIHKRLFYSYPLILVIILTIINFFIPITFSVDSFNVYHREPLLWLSYYLNFTLYLYIIVLLFKNRHTTKKNVWIGFVVIMTIPALGSAIQMLFFGLMLIGASQALTLLIVYIVLETTGNKLDYLTGLSTRAVTDEYIIRLMNKNEEFFVLMIDLDDFKKINDEYGHNVGDKILVFFSDVLKSIFKDSSIIARYGGDEFFIVQKTIEGFDIETIKANIYNQIKLLSNGNQLKENLRFSIGGTVYDAKMSLENILVMSDNEMYSDKAQNKNKRRRKNDSE